MEKEIADIFTASVNETISAMAMTPVTPGAPAEKTDHKTFGHITGIIGMAGNGVSATLALSFEESAILEIFENMLGEKLPNITPDVVDAAGELTNIICGDAKRRLAEKGINVGMATPFLIWGQDVNCRDRVTRKTYSIPFKTSRGTLVLETNFVMPKAK